MSLLLPPESLSVPQRCRFDKGLRLFDYTESNPEEYGLIKVPIR